MKHLTYSDYRKELQDFNTKLDELWTEAIRVRDMGRQVAGSYGVFDWDGELQERNLPNAGDAFFSTVGDILNAKCALDFFLDDPDGKEWDMLMGNDRVDDVDAD